MPASNAINLKQYPFVRLVACFIAGILLQWYIQLSLTVLLAAFCCFVITLTVFSFFSAATIFSIQWLRGVIILLLFGVAGGIAVYVKDIRHNPQWLGTYYQPKQNVLLTIDEPLVEKPNSYKVQATVTAIQEGATWRKVKGDVLLYFYKGKVKPRLHYGSQIILHATLQPITNSGNPGAFDYKQYCLFHDISYQAFVYPGQYTMLWKDGGNSMQRVLYKVRDTTISLLQKTIPGEKEQAVAEALLIGYRDRLDPDIVQAFTNAGVIHIIAISGMHLGMIYVLLLFIFGFFKSTKTSRIIQGIVILLVLWVFSLLAGAVPSITRAAVMFSVIVIGNMLDKNGKTYNTLAASAFILLVYNPFYLWDAGFMLSYSAVLSIVAFFKPVYNWFYVKNRLLDYVWKATAVTISTQVLTLPVILLYFHQFPLMFPVANLIAVPLSEVILYGEMVLLVFSFIPVIAKWLGITVWYLIIMFDGFVQHISRLPFALWDNIYADIPQTLLLYGFILALCWWLLRKPAKGFIITIAFFACLIIYSGVRHLIISNTQKLIVYNVPHQTAIDIMQGSSYRFIGDSILLNDGPLVKYNLKPSRIINGVSKTNDSSFHLNFQNTCFAVNRKKIAMLDNNFRFNDTTAKIYADVIILSKNPKYSILDIQRAFTFKLLVFDSSNPMWKIRRWKKDCYSLHLRFHSVPEQGAFELNL